MAVKDDDIEVGETYDMEALGAAISEDLFGKQEEEEGEDIKITVPGEEGTEAPAAPVAVETPSSIAEGETKAVESTSPLAAPKTWKPEAAAAWAGVPPVVQAEILKREEDIFRGIEGYKADAQVGKTIKSIMQPYEAIMQQVGINPYQQVKQLMDSHYILATGTPQQKIQFMHKLAQDYKIDLGIEAPYVSPEVSGLQQELNAVKSKLQEFETQGADAARAKIRAEIDTFANDPKNVYFSEVSEDIAVLLRSGVAKTLDEAYQKAVRMNPVTYQKEQSRLLKEQQDAEAIMRKKKADDAKRSTAANVSSRSTPGSVTAPLGSIDDTLRETLAKINSRH